MAHFEMQSATIEGEIPREHEMGGQAAQAPAQQESFQLYWSRWRMLLWFSLMSSANGLIWNTYFPISDVVNETWDKSEFWVNFLSLVTMMCYIPAASIGIWVLSQENGLRKCIVFSAFMNLVCTSMRLIAFGKSYPVALISQIFESFGEGFMMGAPPLLASAWFHEDERSKVTSIAVAMNLLGLAGAFLIGPAMVKTPDDLFGYLLIGVAYSFVAFLGIAIDFRSLPPTPPSLSAMISLQRNTPKTTPKQTSVSFALPTVTPLPPALSLGARMQDALAKKSNSISISCSSNNGHEGTCNEGNGAQANKSGLIAISILPVQQHQQPQRVSSSARSCAVSATDLSLTDPPDSSPFCVPSSSSTSSASSNNTKALEPARRLPEETEALPASSASSSSMITPFSNSSSSETPARRLPSNDPARRLPFAEIPAKTEPASAVELTPMATDTVISIVPEPQQAPAHKAEPEITHGGGELSWDDIKSVMTNRDFVLMVMAVGIGMALLWTFSTVLNSILTEGDRFTSSQAGYCGSIMVSIGLFSQPIAGYLLDRTKSYRRLAIAFTSLTAASMMWFAFSMQSDNFINVLAASGAVGFFMSAVVPVCMEAAVEVTYPISEGTTGGILIAAANVFAILFILAFSIMPPYLAIWLFAALMQAVAIIFVIYFRPTLVRLRLETEAKERFSVTMQQQAFVSTAQAEVAAKNEKESSESKVGPLIPIGRMGRKPITLPNALLNHEHPLNTPTYDPQLTVASTQIRPHEESEPEDNDDHDDSDEDDPSPRVPSHDHFQQPQQEPQVQEAEKAQVIEAVPASSSSVEDAPAAEAVSEEAAKTEAEITTVAVADAPVMHPCAVNHLRF